MLPVLPLDNSKRVGLSFQGLFEKGLENALHGKASAVAVAKVKVTNADLVGRGLTEGFEMLNDKRPILEVSECESERERHIRKDGLSSTGCGNLHINY